MAGDKRVWSLSPFIMNEFKDTIREVELHLFADDWKKLMPEMPDGTTFESIRDKHPS